MSRKRWWCRRRCYNGHRRGRRNIRKLVNQSQGNSATANCNKHESSRLLVYQLNAGSIVKNLTLFRSRLYEGKPDVVVVQEDWIVEDKVPYTVDGYTWYHIPRTQSRSESGVIRGAAFRYSCDPRIPI